MIEEAVDRVDARQRGPEGDRAGKIVTPQQKATRSRWSNISERRACGLVGISRTVLHYDPKVALGYEQLKARIVQLAAERRRFGYQRIHALMARELHANHKRIYRLDTEANLAVRRRKKRRGLEVDREALVLPRRPNDTWSMDFVMDTFATGPRLKCLTIVDDCTKVAVDIVADTSIPGQYVARVLDRVAQFRGYPKAIRTDQGPEFTCRALDQWAYRNGVQLKLIQPGKPTQNAYIEPFNGCFRDECLNDHWFLTLEHARAITAAWRRDYNETRPHSALGYQTPAEFAALSRIRADIETDQQSGLY